VFPENEGTFNEAYIFAAPGVTYICKLFGGKSTSTLSRDVTDANATLIASAPELLEALQAVTNHLSELKELIANDDDIFYGTPLILNEARAAIAKATGGDDVTDT